MSVKINLNSIEKIRNFCESAYVSPCKITLKSDIYIVNGKSILGVFSLDLSKDIDCDIEGSDTDVKSFMSTLNSLDVISN